MFSNVVDSFPLFLFLSLYFYSDFLCRPFLPPFEMFGVQIYACTHISFVFICFMHHPFPYDFSFVVRVTFFSCFSCFQDMPFLCVMYLMNNHQEYKKPC